MTIIYSVELGVGTMATRLMATKMHKRHKNEMAKKDT
jgi:hypothetical protein